MILAEVPSLADDIAAQMGADAQGLLAEAATAVMVLSEGAGGLIASIVVDAAAYRLGAAAVILVAAVLTVVLTACEK